MSRGIIMVIDLPRKYDEIKISVIGGLGFAWDRDIILQFLNDVDIVGVAILGGDVLELCDDNIRYKTNYDSWFTNRNGPEEKFHDYCKRSRADAVKYITSYRSSKKVVFAPVLSNDPTAGLLTLG
jgi:hypothetical protein